MNKFEVSFFNKYISEWQEIKWIIHIHFIDVFAQIFLWLSMWAIIPSFMYFYSELIRWLIPFYFLEILLIFVFIKTIYEVFNWYNDVWIITDWWIVALEWALFKTDSLSVEFDKIEWMEVEQDWIIDKIFNKWNLIIHKFWDDSIVLNNAINPYNWVNIIEEADEELNEKKEIEEDKYDIIMDALWWVVENYLEKKLSKNEKQIELEKIITEVEKREWTIDLR
jgi:hypothetical protein